MVKIAKSASAKDDKVNKKTGKAMSRYRLLAGGLEMADPLWEPSEDDVKLAEVRGTIPRAPVVSFNPGDTFYSDKDMVAICGANKVQLIGVPKKGKGNLEEDIESDPTPLTLEDGLVHPAGQVNTGFQHTGGVDNFGNPISGSISKDELEERGLLPEPPNTEKRDAKKEERSKAASKSTEAEVDEDAPKKAKKPTSHGTHGTSHSTSHGASHGTSHTGKDKDK